MSAVELLERARRAGMDVRRVGDRIKVSHGAGEAATRIIAELKLRKAEILALLELPATTLDWSTHRPGKPAPCRLCGELAMMRDADNRPCHKVCAEAATDRLSDSHQPNALIKVPAPSRAERSMR